MAETHDEDSENRWWSIHEDVLLEMLNRVAAGDDPGVVYAKFYVNCDTETVDPE